MPHENASVSAQVLCRPRNHAPVSSIIQSHAGRVRLVCLVVICVRQNDRGLLRASAITQGWNRRRNESTPEADAGEEHSPTVPAGTQQATIQSRVRRPTADLPADAAADLNKFSV